MTRLTELKKLLFSMILKTPIMAGPPSSHIMPYCLAGAVVNVADSRSL